jgi:opacity protein-like surface antigen
MKKIILTVVMLLIIASISYAADSVIGKWSAVAPCINEAQIKANHTIHQWQACYDVNCFTINEYDGTWQKISKGLYQVLIQGRIVLILTSGNMATDTDNATWYKNISLGAAKPQIQQMQCP